MFTKFTARGRGNPVRQSGFLYSGAKFLDTPKTQTIIDLKPSLRKVTFHADYLSFGLATCYKLILKVLMFNHVLKVLTVIIMF